MRWSSSHRPRFAQIPTPMHCMCRPAEGGRVELRGFALRCGHGALPLQAGRGRAGAGGAAAAPDAAGTAGRGRGPRGRAMGRPARPLAWQPAGRLGRGWKKAMGRRRLVCLEVCGSSLWLAGPLAAVPCTGRPAGPYVLQPRKIESLSPTRPPWSPARPTPPPCAARLGYGFQLPQRAGPVSWL